MKSKFSKITREVRKIATGSEILDSKYCSIVDVVKAVYQFEENYFRPLFEIGDYFKSKSLLTDDYTIDYNFITKSIEITWDHGYILSASSCSKAIIARNDDKISIDCWNVSSDINDRMKSYVNSMEEVLVGILKYYERVSLIKICQNNYTVESINSNFSISIDSIRNHVRLYLDREGNYQEKCLTELLPLIDFKDGNTVNTYDIEIYEKYREMCFNKTYVKISDCPEYLRNNISEIRSEYLMQRPFMKRQTLISYWQNNRK